MYHCCPPLLRNPPSPNAVSMTPGARRRQLPTIRSARHRLPETLSARRSPSPIFVIYVNYSMLAFTLAATGRYWPRAVTPRPRQANNKEPPMTESDRDQSPPDQQRRTLLKGMAGSALLAATGGIAQVAGAAERGEELTWMPAWQIRELIGKKDISPVEVTEHFLNRIENLDGKLKSFMTVDQQGARAQARAAEKAVLAGEPLGPLHGIPVSVKDHIAIKGLPKFDMGLLRHIDKAPWDDVQVERLRKAGAILFGTNTEMGSGSDVTKMPREFNWDVEARSAWDQSRVPGWSSSGSATAAVARLVPIAIGSDGGGSTRLPSAYSGIVGIAATPGRIPWIHPSSPTLALSASTGPMCRNLRDAAIATQAMSGPDGRDFFSFQDPHPDFLSDIDKGVDGMRFAWTDDFGYAAMYALEESPRVIAAIRNAAMGFDSIGAKVNVLNEKWDDFFG